MFNLVRIALIHERVVTAVCLRACERIAVLVVLKAPSDCIVGTTACIRGALR